MASLPGLPSLPTLQNIGSAASSAASSTASAVANAAVTAATGGAVNSTSSLTKYVMIGLGVLFIAAGIFSFDKTRELVVSTGKGVVKAGSAAAAAA